MTFKLPENDIEFGFKALYIIKNLNSFQYDFSSFLALHVSPWFIPRKYLFSTWPSNPNQRHHQYRNGNWRLEYALMPHLFAQGTLRTTEVTHNLRIVIRYLPKFTVQIISLSVRSTVLCRTLNHLPSHLSISRKVDNMQYRRVLGLCIVRLNSATPCRCHWPMNRWSSQDFWASIYDLLHLNLRPSPLHWFLRSRYTCGVKFHRGGQYTPRFNIRLGYG